MEDMRFSWTAGLLASAAVVAVAAIRSPSPSPVEPVVVAPTPTPDPDAPPITLEPAVRATWDRLLSADRGVAPAPVFATAALPARSEPRLRSAAWFVADVDSGEVLAAHEADTARPIASLTKLMTALVWADSGADPQAVIELTQEDKDFIQVTHSRLRVGAKYRAIDLLHSSLLSSDNRATVALMRQTGLPREAFTAAMDRRAEALGLTTARFGDPTGLDPADVASPRDVARLLLAAEAHPIVGPVARKTEYSYERVDRPATLNARSSNRLKHLEHWDVVSGKTGYTDIAGSCLVFRGRMEGRDVVVTFLGAQGVDTRYGDAVRLRDWMAAQPPQAVASR